MNQENIPLSNYFQTSDLSLATTLSLFFPIDCIERDQKDLSRKAIFYFKRDEGQLDKLIEAYWKKQLQVEPQAFFNQLKSVKSRIYEDRRPR